MANVIAAPRSSRLPAEDEQLTHGNRRYPELGRRELSRELTSYVRSCFVARRRASATAFARHLRLPRAYVSKAFHEACEEELSTAIQRRQVAEARRLLIRTKRTTADIAEACGFGSATTFYRAFTAEVGITPTEYRRRNERPKRAL
ncbi:MAG TPA: helix-turn-helix domain-containing protein [Thermoanaerobaculia bacterium]|nr:helix-turn-helix domain-containing protein [Thermoanaerobaculia bacterium]